MTLHDFLWLLVGGVTTGLAGAAIYAWIVTRFDRPARRKIVSALRGTTHSNQEHEHGNRA